MRLQTCDLEMLAEMSHMPCAQITLAQAHRGYLGSVQKNHGQPLVQNQLPSI